MDSRAFRFGLKVTPAGRTVYLVQYWLGGRGADAPVTIGQHGLFCFASGVTRLLGRRSAVTSAACVTRSTSREACVPCGVGKATLPLVATCIIVDPTA